MKTPLKLNAPFVVIIMGLMLSLFLMDQEMRKESATKEVVKLSEQIAHLIQQDLLSVTNDLLYLSQQSKAKEVLLGQTSAQRNHLYEEYIQFSELKEVYSQIRLLDINGQEIVRVDRKEGHSLQVTDNELQDKSNRYYFKESEHLPPGEIYRSPLDLNIENGRFVEPYEPTIRYSTPITDYNKNIIGYMILNFNVSSLLQKIKASSISESKDFYLINKDGYYLFHQNPNKQWGFMFNRKDLTLENDNPELWNSIQTDQTVSAVEQNGDFYSVIRLCSAIQKCPAPIKYITLASKSSDMPLYLIGQLSIKKIHGSSWWQNYWIYLIMTLMVLGLIFSSIMSNRLYSVLERLQHKENQLQKSKKRIEKLLSLVPIGLIIINKNLKIDSINLQARKIFEIDEQDILNQSIETILSLDSHQQRQHKIQDFFAKPQNSSFSRDEPYIYINSKNEKQALTITVEPLIVEDEKMAIILVDDITRELQEEEQQRQSQKLEAIGKLVGGVAHDFNNLIGIMMGNLELLELEHQGDDKTKQRIKKIVKASNLAADLTQKLLAVSRKKKYNEEIIDTSDFMADVVNMIQRTIKEHIQVEFITEPNLPQIKTDSVELTNALINLAVNARDAMPKGGHLIIQIEDTVLDKAYTSKIIDSPSPGHYLHIEVSDTGEGMSKEIQEKALEPFFTTKEKGKGTGLGLSMVYGFVKQSKGHMRIYSEQNAGTSIHLYLPVFQNENQHTQPQHQTQSKQMATDLLSGKRVLVVDDEKDLAEVAKDFLTIEGADCNTAYSGQDAMALLHEQQFDLVISDIVMPGEMDGIELLETIRAYEWPIPVILSSGFSEDILKSHHLSEVNACFIKKPYKRQELLEVVSKALGGSGNGD